MLYVATAILLGIVTMVAPLMLLKPSYYKLMTSPGEKNIFAISETLGHGEGTFGERGVLQRAVSPSNLLSAGLMLIPSFLLALGVSLYVKKRVRAHAGKVFVVAGGR